MLRYQATVAARTLCLSVLLGACAAEHSGGGPEHDSGSVDPRDTASIDDDDAGIVDAAASLDATDLEPTDAHRADAQQVDAQQPDAQPETGATTPQLPPTCEEGLSGSPIVLDTADCAQRPANPCTGEQDGDPRPGKFVAKQLFEACGAKGSSFPLGLTLDAQGCPNALYTIPFPSTDPQLVCMRKLLQTQRYPCRFRCSTYFAGL